MVDYGTVVGMLSVRDLLVLAAWPPERVAGGANPPLGVAAIRDGPSTSPSP